MYENTSNIQHSETISCVLDLDDFEKENEEKKEFDESEKIHQTIINTHLLIAIPFNKNTDKLLENYRVLYIEFTTPPPELG